MLVNPGDNVLLDAPTYSGTLAAVRRAHSEGFFAPRASEALTTFLFLRSSSRSVAI